jgi:hypothetical protein
MLSEPQTKQNLETRAKIKLANLVKAIQPALDAELAQFDAGEINYILSHYRKFLRLDLTKDFEAARNRSLTSSPFDSILNQEL